MRSTRLKTAINNRGTKAVRLVLLLLLLCTALLMFGCGSAASDESQDSEATGTSGYGKLTSTEDIGLHDVDGAGTNYVFTYRGEEFRAQYWPDNWTVFDSYKIKKKHDMIIICQALIDIHPVHGSDMVSYRTAEDMAYEWKQHNLACTVIPEDNEWRESAENVDFDPADQGKSIKEIFKDRVGTE